MDSLIDISGVCRTCLQEADEFRSIYKLGQVFGQIMRLSDMILYCASLECKIDDGLPEKICNRCVKNLTRSYAFKKQCNESFEKLLEMSEKAVQDDGPDEIVLFTHNSEEVVVHTSKSDTEDVNHQHQEQQLQRQQNVDNEIPDDEMDQSTTSNQEIETDMTYIASKPDHKLNDEIRLEYMIAADTTTDTMKLVPATIISEHYEYEIETGEAADDDEEEEHYNTVHAKIEISDDQNVGLNENEEVEVIEQSDQENFIGQSDVSDQTNEPQMIFKKYKRAVHNRSNTYKCDICEKVLGTASSHKYHMQLHSDKTPFSCSVCGEAFKTRNACDGHMVTHNEQNPNTCNICGKSYRQGASLRTHMLSHSGEKPFVCSLCGKGMTQKSGYKKHMLTHTGEKPHQCDICKKFFRYSSNLIIHKRSHLKEKPFQCDICKKNFSGRERLKRHLKIHTGTYDNKCKICNTHFVNQKSLELHNLHFDHESMDVKSEDVFVCPTCSSPFKSFSNLQVHMKSSHQLDAILLEKNEDEEYII